MSMDEKKDNPFFLLGLFASPNGLLIASLFRVICQPSGWSFSGVGVLSTINKKIINRFSVPSKTCTDG